MEQPVVPHPGGQYEFSAVTSATGGLLMIDGLTGTSYAAGATSPRFTELARTPVAHIYRMGARFAGSGRSHGLYSTIDGRTWTPLQW